VKIYGVSLSPDQEAAIARRLSAENADIVKAAAHFQALAVAALKIRQGADRASIQSDLSNRGISASELDWELNHLPTVAAAERMARKDFVAEGQEAAREDYAHPFILDHLRRIVLKRSAVEGVPFEKAEEEFWSDVSRSIHTRVIDPAFVLPAQKGILVDR
jgi:hypothetical protein